MISKVESLSCLATVGEIISLHNMAWDNSHGIIDLLRCGTECFLLLDDKSRVVGYAFVEEDRRRGFVDLQDIVVASDRRGRGGGTQLMRAIMAKYRHIKLTVRAGKPEVIAFYEKLGFQRIGLIENYYEIDQDGLRMSWRS